jgi:hypothetical protein
LGHAQMNQINRRTLWRFRLSLGAGSMAIALLYAYASQLSWTPFFLRLARPTSPLPRRSIEVGIRPAEGVRAISVINNLQINVTIRSNAGPWSSAGACRRPIPPINFRSINKWPIGTLYYSKNMPHWPSLKINSNYFVFH